MDASPPTLLTRLADPDPERRASAIREVRYRNLKDSAILARMFELCFDADKVAGQSSSVDPFMAFFSGDTAGTVHIADIAAERLLATGLPTDTATAHVLAEALDAHKPAKGDPPKVARLAEVAARALGETRWDDLDAAVRALFASLEPYDVPLFHAITLLPQSATDTLLKRAVRPASPRLLQELMNHEPSRPRVVAALAECAPSATSGDVSVIAPLLASWGEPSLPALCAIWAERFPWASAWAAIEDPSAAAALERWLATGAPDAPNDLYARHTEVARRRGLNPAFPLAAWLAAAGDDHGLLDALFSEDRSAEASAMTEDLAALLASWAAELAEGRGSAERGWRAIRVLASTGRHVLASEAIARSLSQRIDSLVLLWSDPLLRALATAEPPIASLPEVIVSLVRTAPTEAADAVPAMLSLVEAGRAGACASELVGIVLTAAEAAPIESVRVSKVAVRRARVGIDVEWVRPLAAALSRPDLLGRLDALAPVIEASG